MNDTAIMREGDAFEFEIPYIDAVHFDQFPGVMAREAVIAGQIAPPLDQSFVYCDLGCGTGATVLMLAASYPECEFYGIDLSAKHIEQANAAQQKAGIENATFICGSFGSARDAVPPCDFISAHGILSWIPEEAEQELLTTVQALLKPGGLFQMSANLQPGWGQMSPLRQVMRHFASGATGSPEDRLKQTIRKTASLVASDDSKFGAKNPEARGVTANWNNREAAYVGHEMLGGAWRHFCVGDVIRQCQSYGLECCGPLASAGRRAAEKLETYGMNAADLPTKEDFMSLSAGENFRSLVFVKPTEDGFTRKDMELNGEAVVGFPVFARWSEWAPAPEDELTEWTKGLDDQPHYLGRILAEAMTGKIPEHDFGSVAQMVCGALVVRNAIVYANPAYDVDVKDCETFAFDVKHALTTQILAAPRIYRYGGYVPSTVLGGGVSLTPAQAALLSAFLDNCTDKVGYARELIIKMDAEAPAWALDDESRALPDPAEHLEEFTRDWLPFLLRLGVITARSA